MLKERGYYNIVLSDQTTIPVRFSSWTWKRFCEKKGGISLSELFELLSNDSKATLDNLSMMLLCAAENAWMDNKDPNKAPFTYTDYDACNWIDELGGLEGDEFKEMLNVIATSTQSEGAKKKMTAV